MQYDCLQAHSCVEKAGMIGLVRIHELDLDENFSLRGETLENALAADRESGLIPFYVSADVNSGVTVSQ